MHAETDDTGYILGPDDQVSLRVRDAEEIPVTPFRIDAAGNIDVPLIGLVHAGGLTVDQFRGELASRLKPLLREPMVNVAIVEFRSQPVSIFGSVNKPGVYQVHGPRRILEVLSYAEGLRPDAGNFIKVTREKQRGPLPLFGAVPDSTGRFWIGEIRIKSVLEARRPEDNILVEPNDVITVPKAEMIFVVGSVRKPGGFVVNDNESLSVLQALALAEGLAPAASPGSARILRQASGEGRRVAIPVDLKRVLAAKDEDLALRSNDILFVPNSAARSATVRGIEAAIQVGTGIAIWRH